MEKVIMFSKSYHKVYDVDEFFINKKLGEDQFIIVDSGCPRSLMGEQEYLKVKKRFKIISEEQIYDNFRFGPSKVYKASRKIRLLLRMGTKFQEVGFFIVEGANIPVLLGNDVMDHLDANIDMKKRELVFEHLGTSIPMTKTKRVKSKRLA